jgi:hypothetical protein
MEKTTLYLPVDLQHRLRAEARRRGRPQAELVRDALDAYLRQRKQPWPSCIGIVDDPGFAARDTEEWLEREWHKEL